MRAKQRVRCSSYSARRAQVVLLLTALGGLQGAVAAEDATVTAAGVETAGPAGPSHMSEDIRAAIDRVVVIATRSPAGQKASGSYDKETAGLVGGMAAGSELGRIRTEVGPVPVYIPIPILTIPGAIFGGLSGATRRQIQEFRDALTEELVNADSKTLTDDGLALDVFWAIRRLPGLDSKILAPTAAMPEDTDAVLYVVFDAVGIDVQGKEAVITTSAEASLLRSNDGATLYRQVVHYQDRDTLRNWTDNDNALWRDYVNYARHYLGRAIAAEVFDRVELGHTLTPNATDSAKRSRKDDRLFVSRSPAPTLAWEFTPAASGSTSPWAAAIDESNTFYDVEIYDANQLVYVEEQVPDPYHSLAMELEPCRSYRWSVRPSWHIDGEIRFGDWMRLGEADGPRFEEGVGIRGRQASEAPAYSQDFPLLQIECSRR